jgi:hypothetical protein
LRAWLNIRQSLDQEESTGRYTTGNSRAEYKGEVEQNLHWIATGFTRSWRPQTAERRILASSKFTTDDPGRWRLKRDVDRRKSRRIPAGGEAANGRRRAGDKMAVGNKVTRVISAWRAGPASHDGRILPERWYFLNVGWESRGSLDRIERERLLLRSSETSI